MWMFPVASGCVETVRSRERMEVALVAPGGWFDWQWDQSFADDY